MPKYVILGALLLAASSEVEIGTLVANRFLTTSGTGCHAGKIAEGVRKFLEGFYQVWHVQKCLLWYSH